MISLSDLDNLHYVLMGVSAAVLVLCVVLLKKRGNPAPATQQAGTAPATQPAVTNAPKKSYKWLFWLIGIALLIGVGGFMARDWFFATTQSPEAWAAYWNGFWPGFSAGGAEFFSVLFEIHPFLATAIILTCVAIGGMFGKFGKIGWLLKWTLALVVLVSSLAYGKLVFDHGWEGAKQFLEIYQERNLKAVLGTESKGDGSDNLADDSGDALYAQNFTIPANGKVRIPRRYNCITTSAIDKNMVVRQLLESEVIYTSSNPSPIPARIWLYSQRGMPSCDQQYKILLKAGKIF